MIAYRGYISHCMHGTRSVPQSVQQLVIRNYCEKNGLTFLLSATEFEGSSIMLESIKEQGIVMYSIFCMPIDKEARNRLYNSGKDIRFAAENAHKIDSEFLETIFTIGEWHGTSRFRDLTSYIKQTQLFRADER